MIFTTHAFSGGKFFPLYGICYADLSFPHAFSLEKNFIFFFPSVPLITLTSGGSIPKLARRLRYLCGIL
jgi:hypothetical protein